MVTFKVPHNRITPEKDDVESVASVVKSGHWAHGTETRAAENDIARIIGRKYCLLVSSGLSALRLALLSLGIKQNDEVLVPAYSCVAIPNSILSIGAIPVLVDCDRNSNNISAEDAAKKMSGKCRAVIAVNTFGVPADIHLIREKTSLPVIEDCAHGFGRPPLGQHGDIVIFSFYATKFVGAGEGGALATDNRYMADAVKDLRDYMDKLPDRYRLNDKPNDLVAGLLRNRLRYIKSHIEKRDYLARRYVSGLSGCVKSRGIAILDQMVARIWYRFIIRVDNAEKASHVLHKAGIGAMLPICSWADKQQLHVLPYTKEALIKNLSLPLYPALAEKDQDLVMDTLIGSAGIE